MCLEMAGGIRGPERRIVLMGESGHGKSATGNTILGSHVFECHSATKVCQKEETWLKGRKIVVVDTPGLADTPLNMRFIHKEAAQVIQEILNRKGKNYVILLITHKEELGGKALGEFISEGDPSFRDQVSQCENRVLVFDNQAEGDEREAQVAQLMAMIDELVQKNKDAPYYTEEMLKSDLKKQLNKEATSFLLSSLK